ncbi:hypothetical protein P22_2151 [Propionispora sp. 2/2-37]|nr:hypothetical protein P22_2151 [Propionispora sp. 2/2-37]
MWRNGYHIQWALAGEHLCIKAEWEGEHYILPPFGPENEGMNTALEQFMDYFAANGWPLVIRGAEQFMVAALDRLKPGQFQWVEDRDNFDYVYNTQDLIELSGRKYHSKKNHLNSFKRLYSQYEYVALTPELVPSCLDVARTWWRQHSDNDDINLGLEQQAIADVLQNMEYLGLCGGAISLDGQVIGFTFGERLNEDTVVVHVEKGNPEIRGVFTVINQEYLKNSWQHIPYVNREEDMGIPGLRKAKESYHPVKMIQKYVGRLLK